MILGLGIDLFPIARLERELDRWGPGFLEEFLSEAELRHARALPWPVPRLAASFAGKEAILKTLGTGRTPEMAWREIEILPHGMASSRDRLFAIYSAVCTATGEAGPAGDVGGTGAARPAGDASLRIHGAVERRVREVGVGRITLELEFSGDHAVAIGIAESVRRPNDPWSSSPAHPFERTEPLAQGGLL